MIKGYELIERMYSDQEEEKLYSTGDPDLDDLLEKAFCEGYEYAQREFGNPQNKAAKRAYELKEGRKLLKSDLLKYDDSLALKAARESFYPNKIYHVVGKRPNEASHKTLQSHKTHGVSTERPLLDIGKHRTDRSKLAKLLDKVGVTIDKKDMIKKLDKNITDRGSNVSGGGHVKKMGVITGDSFGKKGRVIE